MELKLRKITYQEYGGRHQTQLSEVSDLAIQSDNEILINVKAASLNPVDWKIRTGEMKLFTGSQFPRGMGCDFAGIVDSVGRKISKFRKGDRVFGFIPFKSSGSFADQIVTTEELIGKIPDFMSFEEAACLPMAGSAALTALTLKSKISKGDRVFIAGCTGGVGSLAVQIAKFYEAFVVGSCQRSDLETAKSIGVDEVYDYSNLDPSRIECCKIVFDTSGRMKRSEVVEILPKGAVPFTVSGKFIDLNPRPSAILRSLISSVHKVVITKVNNGLINELERLANNKSIKPLVGLVYDLKEAVNIIEAFEKGNIKTKGKIVFKN